VWAPCDVHVEKPISGKKKLRRLESEKQEKKERGPWPPRGKWAPIEMWWGGCWDPDCVGSEGKKKKEQPSHVKGKVGEKKYITTAVRVKGAQ